MDTKPIYDRIKTLIDQKGISGNKLLLECGINQSFLNDLKSKNVAPSIEKILKISNYFGVSIDFLVSGQSLLTKFDSNQQELLDLYSQLDPLKQAEFKGELKGYLKAQPRENKPS